MTAPEHNPLHDMSPQPRADVISHLLSVRKEQLPIDNPGIVAVATTSAEMVSKMLRTGVLIDRLPRYPHASNVIAGRPTPAHSAEFSGKIEKAGSGDETLFLARSDAGVSARVHHFIEHTGLAYDSQVMGVVDDYLLLHNPTFLSATQAVVDAGLMDDSNLQEGALGASVDLYSLLPHMPQTRIDELIRDRKQGFIIAIKADSGVRVKEIIEPAYAEQYGKRVGYVFTGPDGGELEGMPYTAIAAIVPTWEHRSSSANDFLDQLELGVLPT